MHASSYRVFPERAQSAFEHRTSYPLMHWLPRFTLNCISSSQIRLAVIYLEWCLEFSGSLSSLVVIDYLIIIDLCHYIHDHRTLVAFRHPLTIRIEPLT